MKRKSLKGAWAFALALLLICSLPFTAFATEESTETTFAPPLNENIGDTLISHVQNFGNAFKSQFSEFSYDIEKSHDGSKNLFVTPYHSGSLLTRHGITYSCDDNGVITLNGTATSNSTYDLFYRSFIPEGVYTISGQPDGASGSSFCYSYSLVVDGVHSSWKRTYAKSFTFEVPEGGGYYTFVINVIKGYTCDNVTFYPQLEAGDKATSFEPYYLDKYIPTPSFICLVTFVCIGLGLSILIIVLNYIFGGNKKI